VRQLGSVVALARELAQTVACTWPLAPEARDATSGSAAHGEVSGAHGEVSGAADGSVRDVAEGFAETRIRTMTGLPRLPSLDVARYLVAFAWSLKAILREPVRAESVMSPEV
jgi:hypothetical protein